MGATAAALLPGRNLPISRSLHLGDQRGLLELRDGAEHLPNWDRCRRVLDEGSGAVARTSVMPSDLRKSCAVSCVVSRAVARANQSGS